MDRGRRAGNLLNVRNHKIYWDLKDIIREHALPFLPAKSLLKFQTVCRDWKLQIANPFFAHNQSLFCRSVLGLFCQVPGEPPSFVAIDEKSCGVPDPLLSFLPEPVDIRSSSNGLLCCQAQTGDKHYYICNPFTKQWQKLPKPNADHGNNPAVVLAFEPSLLNFDIDYKVVCAFKSADLDDATEFEIYSSRKGCWDISGEMIFGGWEIDPRSGIYVNGVVYWKSRSFLAFDLAKERAQWLYGYSYSGILGSINGKLSSSYVSGPTIVVLTLANVHSNTMEMTSNARLWEEKHRIAVDRDMFGGSVNAGIRVIGCGDVLVLYSGKELYSYDLRTKETRVLNTSLKHGCNIFPYVNSLVSL